MKLCLPLKIHLESNIKNNKTYRGIFDKSPTYFLLVDDPKNADIILFFDDNPKYIRKSFEFQNYRNKCLIISEADHPSYFLPACYASNENCLLGRQRALTIPYILSSRTIPNNHLNGNKSMLSKYLYSFVGSSSSWVRKRLFKSPPKFQDVYIQNTEDYNHWNFDTSFTSKKITMQQRYAKILDQSSFVLCPRGAGVSSIRLFEVMKVGKVPIIIADNWIPIDNLPWEKFSLFISEREIESIDEIIRSRKDVAEDFGKTAQEVWNKNLRPGADAYLLADSLSRLQSQRNNVREMIIRFIFPAVELYRLSYKNLRSFLRLLVLSIFKLIGKSFPYTIK